mgnify:CR=1 FL=1
MVSRVRSENERRNNRERMKRKWIEDPEHRASWTKWRNGRKARRRYWLNKYKIAKGCAICSYNKHFVSLDFHHYNKPEKSFEISEGMSKRLKVLMSEVRKCTVLCSNCHREEHYKEKHCGI